MAAIYGICQYKLPKYQGFEFDSGTDHVSQLKQEVVPLRKVCRRPETEQRLQQAREANAASSRLANSESTRALNGTPSTLTASQIPPTTPATPAQLSSAFNATPNPYTGTSNLYTPLQQGTSTPGLEPMQPIPMQSMSTPDPTPPIFQQTIPPPAAPTHSTDVLQGAAVSSSQVPAPSMPIGSQSTTTPQVTTSASPLLLKFLE